mgnify:CR=1 FL=1
MSLRYLPNVATLQLDRSICNGCRMCLTVCPHNVFMLENKRAVIADLDACMECGACQKNCPEEAIAVQAGVGCAYALIKSRIYKTEVRCGCETEKASCC